MGLAIELVRLILSAFLICLFARVILSYFPISYGSPVAGVQRVVGAVTDPVLTPVRKIVPPLNLGGGGVLDMSPVIVFVVVFILLGFI
ncbi:MAG: YggT family protein [Actinomycetota bacterium]|jgi:YggT family protein|nr:YggT family protein [Actinomycetota bacterium]